MAEDGNEILNVKQVAEILGVCERKVRQWTTDEEPTPPDKLRGRRYPNSRPWIYRRRDVIEFQQRLWANVEQ